MTKIGERDVPTCNIELPLRDIGNITALVMIVVIIIMMMMIFFENSQPSRIETVVRYTTQVLY